MAYSEVLIEIDEQNRFNDQIGGINDDIDISRWKQII